MSSDYYAIFWRCLELAISERHITYLETCVSILLFLSYIFKHNKQKRKKPKQTKIDDTKKFKTKYWRNKLNILSIISDCVLLYQQSNMQL